MVRSLVISPHEDMRTWLKYASLCGKSGRLVSTFVKGKKNKYNPRCNNLDGAFKLLYVGFKKFQSLASRGGSVKC